VIFGFSGITGESKIVQLSFDTEQENLATKVSKDAFVAINGYSIRPSECGTWLFAKLHSNSKVSMTFKLFSLFFKSKHRKCTTACCYENKHVNSV